MGNPKLHLEGNVEIKYVEEPYRRSGFKRESVTTHYAVISARFYGGHSATKIDIDVPVSKEIYDNLKKLLSSSKAELPQLKISGDLEIIAEGICIN